MKATTTVKAKDVVTGDQIYNHAENAAFAWSTVIDARMLGAYAVLGTRASSTWSLPAEGIAVLQKGLKT